MMKKSERLKWLMDYFRKEQDRCNKSGITYRADVLDALFVADYLTATGANFKPMKYGADKCPMLGRDLSELSKTGRLERSSMGLGAGSRGEGFPAWVWCYTLPKLSERQK